MSATDHFFKRCFDAFFSVLGLASLWWLIAAAWLLATIDTRKNGFFTQLRVGRDGRQFKVIKIRTMKELPSNRTTVTTSKDPRVTRVGSFLRKTKIDELPQLVNVLFGQMSFVGPRPDVPGFADMLCDEDLIILSVRPGITGPATIKYRNEEEILGVQGDPEKYNREVLFPEKVKINRNYINNYTFLKDMSYIMQTIFPGWPCQD